MSVIIKSKPLVNKGIGTSLFRISCNSVQPLLREGATKIQKNFRIYNNSVKLLQVLIRNLHNYVSSKKQKNVFNSNKKHQELC